MADLENGWKEVTMDTNSTVWDKKNPVEGLLTSVKEKVGPNESKLYTVQTKEGDVAVWGSTVLDNKFSEIMTGMMVRIEPRGKVKSEKTGREYEDFSVFYRLPKDDEKKKVDLNEIPFD